MSRRVYEAVFVVVDRNDEPAYVGDKGAPIYSRKHDAVRKCRPGSKVLKFKLENPEVVHEGGTH